MPVTLEQIIEVAPQDSQDLVRIYRSMPNIIVDDYTQWICNKVANRQILFAGRFNGRIVGSVWATLQHLHNTHTWQLEDLCVREITRRRGVARQLLTLLAHKAQTRKIQLTIADTPICKVIHPLLIELGFKLTTFSPQSSLWHKNHQ